MTIYRMNRRETSWAYRSRSYIEGTDLQTKHRERFGFPCIYSITAYKPDSEDVCRGCRMGSYSSDIEFSHTSDKEKTLDFLTRLTALNLQLRPGEEPYEFTFHNPFREDFREDGDLCTPHDELRESLAWDYNSECEDMLKEAGLRAEGWLEHKIREQRVIEQASMEAARELAIEAQKAQELQTYLRLKQKFEAPQGD